MNQLDLKKVLTEKGYFTNLASKVGCQDRGIRGGRCEYCRDGHWFICKLCDRSVPYCFGASHKNPEYSYYCDSCWYQAFQSEEAAA